MVLERLFSANWVERKPGYSLLLGVLFTLVGFGTSMFLFYGAGLGHFVGVSTMLFTVIVTIPGMINLFSLEEDIEKSDMGSAFKNFFKDHEAVIDFHLYFFVGVFVVLFIIAMVAPQLVFSQESLYNIPQTGEAVKRTLFGGRLPPVFSMPTILDAISVMLNNMYVMVLAFVLSLFYGTGALFLITLNASVFASSLASVVRADIIAANTPWAVGLIASCHLSVMFIHAIPELLSYFLAAIAGGVMSKAFTQEKFRSPEFHRVLKDSFILIGAAFLVVAFSAFIEVMISKRLFFANICSKLVVPMLVAGGIILFALIYLEIHRKHIMFRKEKKAEQQAQQENDSNL